MSELTPDRIEESVELAASRGRVWRALTESGEFGRWFGVALESPFVVGLATRGRITYPGYERLVMEVVVREMAPERVFSFAWHPYAVEAGRDYSKEPPTLVEFRLEDSAAGGTRLTLTESGFRGVPEARRAEAYRMNKGGWAEQMKNIRRHVDGAV
jgi:uncharacterized protein YndB with AHSA1/START domain